MFKYKSEQTLLFHVEFFLFQTHFVINTVIINNYGK